MSFIENGSVQGLEFTSEQVQLSKEITDTIANKIISVLREFWDTPSLRRVAPVVIGMAFDFPLSNTWVRSPEYPEHFLDITMGTTEWPTSYSVKYAEHYIRLRDFPRSSCTTFSNRLNTHPTPGLIEHGPITAANRMLSVKELTQLHEAVRNGTYEQPGTHIIGMENRSNE